MAKQIITDETTAKVADLIKIRITNEEVPVITGQLNTVLDSVEVLEELNTSNVSPTSQTHGNKNVLREDEVEEGLDMRNYKNTKNFSYPNFTIQKVL